MHKKWQFIRYWHYKIGISELLLTNSALDQGCITELLCMIIHISVMSRTRGNKQLGMVIV